MTDLNDDLRILFAEATADVRPSDALDEIRSRATVRPRRATFPLTVAAAAVVGLVAGGVLYATRTDVANPPPAGRPPVTSSHTVAATIYYAGTDIGDTRDMSSTHGVALFPERHLVAAAGDGNVDPLVAANLAVNGIPSDPDYRSLWPAGVRVTSVTAHGTGHDADIDVRLAGNYRARPASMTDREQMLAIVALAGTLGNALGMPDASLHFDGPGTTSKNWTVLGDLQLGIGWAGVIGNGDSTELAPIEITNIVNGMTVTPGDLVVEGTATGDHVKVEWGIRSATGVVGQHGSFLAGPCCDLTPYSFTVRDLQPGSYTLVVHDNDEFDASKPANQDTKEIIVR
ncbi:MAG: hypothetical protein JWP74_2761 [Marmoricola sp.]|nr:hypothetical protein [Marmoricola sp.]